MFVHEKSYKGSGLRQIIHRSRLTAIIEVLCEVMRHLKAESTPRFADFGCSNGFILRMIQNELVNSERWLFYGFDHNEGLLNLARKKNLPNTSFAIIDLNHVNNQYTNHFDIVTCFETLEHVGNYKNAFETLYLSTKVSGLIIISIPNEVGIPGIMKYFARKVRNPNCYDSFFKDKSELGYILDLFLRRNIERYRDEELNGWGPHLGFDYRCFQDFVGRNYFATRKCELCKTLNTNLRFNKIYVIKESVY
jgi:2-polyprenyl-3-methyl-5-hydroxy-6-metoxy-1,4-benzoquinol methylase